jgi:glutathione S-transferase
MLIVHHLQCSQSERIIGSVKSQPYASRAPPCLAAPTIHPLTCLRPSHPQGSAPIIQDGAITLAESNAIVEYILTQYGRGQLQVAPDAPNYADYLY